LYKLLLKLQDLDYTIIYCPGKQNTLDDLLSRLNEENASEAKTNTLDVKLNIDWEHEQDNERDLALVKMAVRSRDENILQESIYSRFWSQNFNNLQIENGILKFKNRDGNLVIVAPRQLWSKICSIYHDAISGGHLSSEKTFRSIASRLIWPQFHSFILDFCITCDICQRFKQLTRKPNRHPLVSIKITKI
jgi:hypothetical protein